MKVGTTQMSTNRKVNKEVTVYIYTMRYYLVWKKTTTMLMDQKQYVVQTSTYPLITCMWSSWARRIDLRWPKLEQWFQWAWTGRAMRELSGTIEDSCLDWSGGYRGICFTQNLSNYILLWIYVNFASIKKILKYMLFNLQLTSLHFHIPHVIFQICSPKKSTTQYKIEHKAKR